MCLAVCLTFASPLYALAAEVTVLYDDRTVTIDKTLADPDHLWVTPADLTRINGFVLKPEGACLKEICVPVNPNKDSDLLVTRDGQKWFNISQLAKSLNQAVVMDRQQKVWSFGVIGSLRAKDLKSATAPDFALPDRQGKLVRLSDFRGKKVFLLSWASW